MTIKLNQNLILDFDSTLVSVESLDELAKISLNEEPDRDELVNKIRELTALGMEGKISINESLEQRVKLLSANKEDLAELIALLGDSITPSFAANQEFLKANRNKIWVVTNGFEDFVAPVIAKLGLKPENLLANTFKFKANKIIGFDQTSLLSKAKGKVEAVKSLKLKGETWVIGDGVTDKEIKDAGLANKFVAFTEIVERRVVTDGADLVARSFDEVLYSLGAPTRHSYPKTKIRCFLYEGIHVAAVKRFVDEGFIVESIEASPSNTELKTALKYASILGIRSKTAIKSNLLEDAKKLLAVGAFCIGTDQIEIEGAREKGVAVFNAPYSNTRSVVELAIGEIIMLSRATFVRSTELHSGIWNKSAKGSKEVRGKKLGIVGYGNIGSQLSVLAESLGIQVYYYDIEEKLVLGNARRLGSLEELLERVDIVSVHVDGRAENKNLFGENEFKRMRKGAIFLNLARGSIVDLKALSKALKGGHLSGAAVDVFPEEPRENGKGFKSPLLGVENVIVTPHIGGSTAEAQKNIAEFVAERLIQYVNTGSTTGSVSIPELQLPPQRGAHRLLHYHRNVPGVLAEINNVLANGSCNILGQYLNTKGNYGYVILDIDKEYGDGVLNRFRKMDSTIKFRVLY